MDTDDVTRTTRANPGWSLRVWTVVRWVVALWAAAFAFGALMKDVIDSDHERTNTEHLATILLAGPVFTLVCPSEKLGRSWRRFLVGAILTCVMSGAFLLCYGA
jgi:hypothetical protein